MTRLNQVLAIEADIRRQTASTVAAASAQLTVAPLLNGLTRTYVPADEGGDTFPDEGNLVQQRSEVLLQTLAASLIDLFDVTATKEEGNRLARADVRIGDKVIISQAPATLLLFFGKQLDALEQIVRRAQTYEASEEWTYDPKQELYKTDKRVAHRTEKRPKVIERSVATDKHPAQTELIYVDERVGTWTTVKLSGAFSPARQRILLARIQQLRAAVNTARAAANLVEVEQQKIGERIFGWLLTGE